MDSLTKSRGRVTNSAVVTCSKKFVDIPFAHRAPHHEGHCRLIHGHNWSFDITFTGEPDRNGFVIDFGRLRSLRDMFATIFDHKMLINEADPLAQEILRFLRLHEIDNVTLVEDCSSEGIAKLVFGLASAFVKQETEGRVWVTKVIVCESETNLATYSA